LREFAPPPGSYDLVWAQWVLGHLTDNDVVSLLGRCRASLRPNGAVVVKDNVALPSDCDQLGGKYLLDLDNAAVIRTHAHLRSLFKLAGLKMVRSELQGNFPEDLHPVRHYWLVPAGALASIPPPNGE
jgi:protein N-terminal methyltransferase